MAKATILFADNDQDFLKTRSEFLEQEGYLVVPAKDPTEARRKLETGAIELAILDIRLVNDDDEKDTSGLTLAKEVARSVPKVILTGFPSYEYVREALKLQVDGLPAAVDFVAKQEGPEALLASVRRVLSRPSVPRPAALGWDIFVVHGHDDAAKDAVARFIERLGLKAIIIRDLPNRGYTIIEKFEEYAKTVGFAVVLLTPDDIGSPRDKPKERKPRPRQNVIFEMGFFIGKLGRDRVCALRKDDVQILSDYQGVVYVPMDSAGGWRWSLAQEIKTAGIPFDLNKVIEG